MWLEGKVWRKRAANTDKETEREQGVVRLGKGEAKQNQIKRQINVTNTTTKAAKEAEGTTREGRGRYEGGGGGL